MDILCNVDTNSHCGAVGDVTDMDLMTFDLSAVDFVTADGVGGDGLIVRLRAGQLAHMYAPGKIVKDTIINRFAPCLCQAIQKHKSGGHLPKSDDGGLCITPH